MPSYDEFISGLSWEDEFLNLMQNLSPDGVDLLKGLWKARNIVFHYPQISRPIDNLLLESGVNFWSDLWEDAKALVPVWPGFSREILDERSKKILIDGIRNHASYF